MLETAGWNDASSGAKQRLEDCVARLKSAGVEIRTRHNDKKVAALEAELPKVTELSHRINGWEGRWFFRSMRDRDINKMGPITRERVDKYEDVTLEQHRADLKERARIRGVYAELAAVGDACITLPAPSTAPEGLGSTGNPEFGVPSSLLGRADAVAAGVRARWHAARAAGHRLFRPRRRCVCDFLLADAAALISR